jgi:hypothetical protein
MICKKCKALPTPRGVILIRCMHCKKIAFKLVGAVPTCKECCDLLNVCEICGKKTIKAARR